ncbi:hypothetical protein KCU68_g47, partial [Aureobasidium melanogenum]
MVQEVLGLVQTIGRTISGKVVVETKLERPDHNFEGEQNSRFVLGCLRTVCGISCNELRLLKIDELLDVNVPFCLQTGRHRDSLLRPAHLGQGLLKFSRHGR